MSKGTQKIWFLQLVRMLACSLVIYVHWYGLITNPNGVSNMIMQDPIVDYPSLQLTEYLIIIFHRLGIDNFVAGFFSLGLFFMLSGYVIPMSLKNPSPSDYLIRRLLRIYPTLFVCLTLAASTMTIANYYMGSSPGVNLFSPQVLIPNLLLLRDALHAPYIERAIWTLEIELHFYLLFFIFLYFSIHQQFKPLVVTTLIFLGLGQGLVEVSQYCNDDLAITIEGMGNLICMNNSYLSFMFVATALYYTLSKQWSQYKGGFACAILLFLNYLALHSGTINQASADTIFINHVYGLLFFLVLYKINDYIPYSKLLNHLADISYPLYLLHGFTGFTFYFVLFHLTHNVTISTVGGISLVLLFANLIHFTVERPSIVFAKEFLNRRKTKAIDSELEPAS